MQKVKLGKELLRRRLGLARNCLEGAVPKAAEINSAEAIVEPGFLVVPTGRSIDSIFVVVERRFGAF